jgi:hypothetical protein
MGFGDRDKISVFFGFLFFISLWILTASCKPRARREHGRVTHTIGDGLAQVLRLPEEEQRRSKTKRTTKASLARIAVHFDYILTRNSSAEEAAFRLSSLQ